MIEILSGRFVCLKKLERKEIRETPTLIELKNLGHEQRDTNHTIETQNTRTNNRDSHNNDGKYFNL